MKLVIACAMALGLVGTSVAEEARFTAAPRVEKVGTKTVITFAVSTPTDVAVAILDAKKTVVRHLAAGLLGRNAPAPLKKDSLSQELAWDFADDYGRKLPAGRYTVRVGLGLKPEFDQIFGYDPNTLGVVRGLAVGPGGEIFVLNLGHHLGAFGSTVCNVFDRDGVYRRTIMPYPRSSFPAKVKAFGVLDLGRKGVYPWLHANHLKSIYPFTAEPRHQRPVVTPDGRFILTMPVRGRGTALVAVDAKHGGVPAAGAFGPAFGQEMLGFACLALAGDGKTIYVSGAASKKRYKPIRPKHAVYRAKWGDKTIMPFIGDPEKAGKGDQGFDAPQGVAVDKDGNVYVADRGNNRVAVFGPAGKLLNELPVETPYMLSVHRTGGAVYVLGKGDPPEHIIKFKSRTHPQPVYVHKAPGLMRSLRGKKRIDAYPVFALDDTGKEPVLWVGTTSAYDRFRLHRFVEKGGRLGKPQEKGKGPGYRSCRQIHVDKRRDEIYIQLGGDTGVAERYRRLLKISGANGKVLKSLGGSYGNRVGYFHAFGQDDHLYMVQGGKQIRRYDRDLKPAPFPGRDTHVSDPIPGHRYSLHLIGRGMAVRHDRTMYVLHENVPVVHQRYGVSVWGPDGKLRQENLIGSLSQGALSLRMDPAGNLYVGDPVKPAGQVVPPDLRGKVDAAKKPRGRVDNHYPIMYGSILKFPPTGGPGVGPKVTGLKAVLAYDAPVGIKGHLWQYFGVGPVPAYGSGTYKHYAFSGCSCESMRFDVDGHGRVFAPDAARFRVVVLDTNGNEIGAFGEYGNQDSTGSRSKEPRPAIPFAWPAVVGVSDRAAYVSDLLNRRVVRVKLGYTVEANCPVP